MVSAWLLVCVAVVVPAGVTGDPKKAGACLSTLGAINAAILGVRGLLPLAAITRFERRAAGSRPWRWLLGGLVAAWHGAAWLRRSLGIGAIAALSLAFATLVSGHDAAGALIPLELGTTMAGLTSLLRAMTRDWPRTRVAAPMLTVAEVIAALDGTRAERRIQLSLVSLTVIGATAAIGGTSPDRRRGRAARFSRPVHH